MAEQEKHSQNQLPKPIENSLLLEKRDQLLEDLYDFEVFRKHMLLSSKRSVVAMASFGGLAAVGIIWKFLIYKQILDPLLYSWPLWLAIGIGILGLLIGLATYLLIYSDLS